MSDYPNDGQAVGIYPTEPDKRQAKAARKEETDMGASLPVIEDVIKWFDDQITTAGSLDDVVLDDNMSNDNVVRQVMVQKQLVKKLTEKRDELRSKFNGYIQARKEKRDES